MQSHRVNLSIASPSEIERTARQLMAIREDFLSTGSLDFKDIPATPLARLPAVSSSLPDTFF